MKSLTVLFLILVTLFTTQAFAEDATPQPLTRADCETAPGWSWSETANICEGGAKDVAALKAPASYAKRLRAGRHVLERHGARLR